MADINARIEAKIRSFSEELQALIGSAVREHVDNALASIRAGAAPRAPRAAAAPKAAAAAAAKPPKASRRKGAKRSATEIAKTRAALQAYIGAEPGQRMEQIGTALGMPTKDLTRPLAKLLASGAVRREGAKRASRYFPTGEEAGTAAPAKARRARKPAARKASRRAKKG